MNKTSFVLTALRESESGYTFTSLFVCQNKKYKNCDKTEKKSKKTPKLSLQ